MVSKSQGQLFGSTSNEDHGILGFTIIGAPDFWKLTYHDSGLHVWTTKELGAGGPEGPEPTKAHMHAPNETSCVTADTRILGVCWYMVHMG